MKAIILAGANGSGKTTVANALLQKEQNLVYLGADILAEKISPDDVSKVKISAGRLFVQELEKHIKGKSNLLIETTLSGSGSARMIKNIKASGYFVTLNYLFLESPDACVARVAARVKQGGHDVPEDDIRRRYLRSLNNFWSKCRFLVDEWQLFYNSDISYEEVAVGLGDEYVIGDHDLFNLFSKNIGIENA